MLGNDSHLPVVHGYDPEGEYRNREWYRQMQLLEKARAFVRSTEGKYGIGPFRFGLDAIIGLIPCGVGDFLTTVAAFYMVMIGISLQLPWWKVLMMVFHILADGILGTLQIIPFSGDIIDVFYKANRANLSIIEKHLIRRWTVEGGPQLPSPNSSYR
ncbi:MAG TPA: DUF4112 domain-containing protein [Patescibacteria group bacterium]